MAQEGLRKRKQPPPSDKSTGEVEGKVGEKRRKYYLPIVDPFACLNTDVKDVLLSYLSSADLARCECVSRRWRDETKDFSARFGTRIHFPHLWNLEEFHSMSKIARYNKYKELGM
jgi:hypothetical protein